jgi:4-amino-4-deoxy-L-arabinose transferase-like glycosyltransferase
MRKGRLAIVLIIAATAIRLALAAAIPLFPDETYYWEWSRRLAAGYFDHPPAIAFLIRTGTAIFGDTALGVRFGAILAGAVASCAIVVMSWRLADGDSTNANTATGPSGLLLSDAGVRAALLLLVIPAALVGFVIATPDAPLLAAIALTLAALERAIAAPARSRDAFGWWCAAGVTLGLAFCSKYTSVLIPAGVLVALLTRRDLRARLATPGPYVATLIALLVLAPTLFWNSRHEWISFTFQLHHGLGQTRGSIAGRELALAGGQLGLISPVLAVLAIIAVARALRRVADPRRYLLAIVATTVVAFFALSALRRPVEANWPVPALVAALPLLAAMSLSRRSRGWLVAGATLGAICIAFVAAQATLRVIKVHPRRDPMSRAQGWSDLAAATNRAKATATGCSAILFAADRYQDASELAFNLPDHPRVFALNLGGRANQYDLWPSIYATARAADCALVVVDQGTNGEGVVKRIGADMSMIVGNAVMQWYGVPVGRRTIWLVHGIPDAPLVEVDLSASASSALHAAATTIAQHQPLLDSIVTMYRRGPVPDSVTTQGAAPLSNADQQVAIGARIDSLHALLTAAGLRAVYRDARYHECTFVRTAGTDSTDIGYVYAPGGCKIESGHGDRVLRVAHAGGDWYAYAAPEPYPD